MQMELLVIKSCLKYIIHMFFQGFLLTFKITEKVIPYIFMIKAGRKPTTLVVGGMPSIIVVSKCI